MTRGYTLIELLVVISIIAILSVIGFANYKNFSSDQVVTKAEGQIQSLLRLAQSNATSSTKCNDSGSTSWSLIFLNATTIELRCNPSDFLSSTTTLENAQIDTITGSNCMAISPSTTPFTITYSSGSGTQTLSYTGASLACLASDTWTFSLKNTEDATKTKQFTISKGGAINVQ